MDTSHICLGCMEEKGDAQVCPKCGYTVGTQADNPIFLKPGTILKGQYLLGRILGSGGFGITYLARDLNLGVKLAVKEYFPSGMVTRAAENSTVSVYSGGTKESFEYGLEKFIDEARTLAKFDDVAEIVTVKDFFKENGTAYIVMSYIDGITLKEYLAQKGGRLPLDAVLTFMLPVMKALERVHAAGILHRDVSPDNIYVTKSYDVKLLDFGAARFAVGERSQSLSVLLKPGYAPEEQYRTKGNQGPWSDVYAVAATIYKLLTGQTPPEALDRVNQDDLKPISAFGAEVPANIEAAVRKALSVKAENRYRSMSEFETALTSSVTANNTVQSSRSQASVPQQPQYTQTGQYQQTAYARPATQPTQYAPSAAAQPAPGFNAIPYAVPAKKAKSTGKTVAIAILGVVSGLFFILFLAVCAAYSESDDKYKSAKDRESYTESRYESASKAASSNAAIINKVKEQLPVIITNIKINNTKKNGDVIKADQTKFSKKDVQYIDVTFDTDYLIDTKDDIYVKYIDPYGKVMTLGDGSSPSGYSLIAEDNDAGMGNGDGFGHFNNYTGTYTIQLWCKSKLVGQKNFIIE